MGGGLIMFCCKQFQSIGLQDYLPGPMGAITYGLLTSIVLFVVVSLVTSNARILDMQREYDEILGETAAQPAD